MALSKTRRFLLLSIGYAALIHASYLAALLLRFDLEVPARYVQGYLQLWPVFTLLSLGGFFLAGLYHELWRYASSVTLFQVMKGATLSAFSLVLIAFFTPQPLFPGSLVVMVWLLQIVLLGGVRFAWRLSREGLLGRLPGRPVRTLVVGANETGVHLIQEMRRSGEAERLTPVGFLDDDARLTGQRLEGVEVRGTIADLPLALRERRVELVIIADPEIPARVVRGVATLCDEAEVRVKTLPRLSDLQPGRTPLSQIRDVRLEDLLRRAPVRLDLGEVASLLRGERVLVTGAGGSIGSELARQIADFAPAELVLLDHAENGLYYTHTELIGRHPALPMHPVVADIKDAEAIGKLFDRFRPTVVFHAAAHKHVPLLEANPREAVLNNVLGTLHLVRAADRVGVGKFVLLSTDKAVNPTSVMGATKRVCEMLVQSRSARSRTRYVAVRFGNVLGSEGSVVPLFQRQLERGGPITVTHPDARRYFMTIPEAVRLVLQGSAMGRGGEVLMLDMGEQVKILELARQLIRIAGLHEGKDIQIVFTGLRPGEKLHEELHSDAERTRMTRHERILMWDLDAREEESLLAEVAQLEAVAHGGDAEAIKRQLHRLVPEYAETLHPPLEPAGRPAAIAPAVVPSAARVAGRRSAARGALEGALALALLVLSLPLWLLVWLESSRGGPAGRILVHEVRAGRSRRWSERRIARVATPIDRRGVERRSGPSTGVPIRCSRFRADLGPVSRWLARHHLARLPYLLNVVRGEMALVGPEPVTEERSRRLEALEPGYARRFGALPGVTGLAQVAGLEDLGPEADTQRARHDLEQVEHASLGRDLRTLMRTLAVVLRPAGRRGGRRRVWVGPAGAAGSK